MRIYTLFLELNNRLSMKKKIFLSYIFLILIPACLMMFFYYRKSADIIEKGVTNSILQALKQTEMNISYKLEVVENVSNMLTMNENLYTFLGRDELNTPMGQKIDDANELLKIIRAAQDNKYIYKIRLFMGSDRLYSGELNNLFPLDMIQKEDWYNGVIDNNGRIFWRNTRYERYINDEYVNVISCMRMLRHPDKYDELAGVLSVDLPEQFIYEIISKVDVTDKQNIYVTDKNGTIISCYDKGKLRSVFLQEHEVFTGKNSGEGIFKVGNGVNSDYIIYKTVEKNGWKVVAQVPVEEISKSNDTFSSVSGIIFIIVSLIIFMLALFLFAAFLTEGMNKRIKSLIHNMEMKGIKSIGEGRPDSEGDIYKLEENFNTLAGTVKRLTEESFQARLNEREAELKALQAQINPHFLYNTLDMINWMAVRRNAEDISEMIDSLAKYFRYSLNKGRDIVSISDEIELARAYLAIQKKRFGNVFTVSYTIDEEVGQYLIPKLILQPIIENALIHGIQEKSEGYGLIDIEAIKKDADIIITVSDNGAGITEEKLGGLLKTTGPNNYKSYGLFNINERIRLFSGNEDGIDIFSVYGEGTRVSVKLKAVKNS